MNVWKKKIKKKIIEASDDESRLMMDGISSF